MKRGVLGIPVIALQLAAVVLGGIAPLLLAAPALAQTAVPTHEVSGVVGYGAWDWISLTLRMGAVLLVIWGSVVGMRWYVRRMNGEAGAGMARALQIVETRALGPNRALHLVRLGDRAVLIGATPERINALMEIDDPAQLERLFAGGDEPTRRTAVGLFAGLATSLPALASKAGTSLATRAGQRQAAQAAVASMSPAPAAAPARPRPAGILTDVLARLGRRMRGTSKPPAAPATRVGIFGAVHTDVPAPRIAAPMTSMPPAMAALEAALEGQAPRRVGSLFDRTLADAQRTQARGNIDRLLDDAALGMPAPAAPPRDPGMSAAGLRARAGYSQAAPTADDLLREQRINELQQAIIAARRNAG